MLNDDDFNSYSEVPMTQRQTRENNFRDSMIQDTPINRNVSLVDQLTSERLNRSVNRNNKRDLQSSILNKSTNKKSRYTQARFF